MKNQSLFSQMQCFLDKLKIVANAALNDRVHLIFLPPSKKIKV